MITPTITNSTMTMTTVTMITTIFLLLADCSLSDDVVVTSELDGRSVHAVSNHSRYK